MVKKTQLNGKQTLRSDRHQYLKGGEWVHHQDSGPHNIMLPIAMSAES